MNFKPWQAFIVGLAWLGLVAAGRAADFNVTTPGGQFAFMINAVNNNPTITLVRGRTYTFAVSTDGFHPFRIGAAVFGSVPPGVTGENTSSGTVTFAVPANAANCVYYCGFHGFSGSIVMVNPPAPTASKILALTVGTNLNLKFTGSNTFSYFPEYNTNLATTNWYALTVTKTNAATNGTNDVICGKPPGNNVFIRVRAQ
ncbi:MAG: hypothetical protein RL616_1548 [Verrucomicrobiota bacterium]